jgi:hypothetical protein
MRHWIIEYTDYVLACLEYNDGQVLRACASLLFLKCWRHKCSYKRHTSKHLTTTYGKVERSNNKFWIQIKHPERQNSVMSVILMNIWRQAGLAPLVSSLCLSRHTQVQILYLIWALYLWLINFLVINNIFIDVGCTCMCSCCEYFIHVLVYVFVLCFFKEWTYGVQDMLAAQEFSNGMENSNWHASTWEWSLTYF